MAAPKGNKFAMGNKGGRPGHFKTPNQLENWVNLFFSNCEKEGKRPKLTAMYNFLGVWNGYFNEKGEEFVRVIKMATAKIAGFYEDALDDKQTIPALGIFMLKNCGYADRIEVNANISDTSSLADLAKAVRDKHAKQGKH